MRWLWQAVKTLACPCTMLHPSSARIPWDCPFNTSCSPKDLLCCCKSWELLWAETRALRSWKVSSYSVTRAHCLGAAMGGLLQFPFVALPSSSGICRPICLYAQVSSKLEWGPSAFCRFWTRQLCFEMSSAFSFLFCHKSLGCKSERREESAFPCHSCWKGNSRLFCFFFFTKKFKFTVYLVWISTSFVLQLYLI